MLEQHIINLINADIDGELGPEEQVELAAILKSSAEARTMKEELLRLSHLMDSVPEMEPPRELSRQILDQLAPTQFASKSTKPKFSLAGLFPSFQPATAGLAFAAGLLLTVGFYEISPRSESAVDTAEMVGTMVAGQHRQQTQAIDSLSIDEAGLSGTVSLHDRGGILVMNFELESGYETEIEVALAEAGLSFGGIARVMNGDDIAEQTYEISGGVLRVVERGRQAFSVFLSEAANDTGSGRAINIEISSNGAQLFSGVLRG